jgi:hypothetical protein
MRVLSKMVCGYARDGRVLLQKGENVLAEPLTSTERAFIDAMKLAGVVTILSEGETAPAAPISETKIKVSTRVDTAPRKPMRKRGVK